MKVKKKMTTRKLVPIDAIDDMETIISCGFDLFNSIKDANWSYNSGKGLPMRTAHMAIACKNWLLLMEQFNRKINETRIVK